MPDAPSSLPLYGTEDADKEKPFAVSTTVPGAKPTRSLLPTSAVVRVCLIILGVALAAYAVYRVLPVLLLLMVSIMLATAIEPIVTKLRRGPFSRSQGVLIVYTGIFLVLVIIGWLIIPVFINQVGDVMRNLPASLADFQKWAEGLSDPFLRGQATQAARALNSVFNSTATAPAGNPTEQVANVSTVALGLAETALSVVVVFVIAFYWMTERTRIKRWLISLLPSDRANRVRRVWDEIELKVGGWVRGQLTLMALVGLISAVGYFTIGLRYWPALALFIALAEAVPLVGPYIGTAPAILVALTQPGPDGLAAVANLGDMGGVTRALLVIVFAVLLQTVEGNVLVPRIMRNSVGISALTVIVSLLLGSALDGLVGALLAVPVAGAIQVIIMDLQAAATARAEQEKRGLEQEQQQAAAQLILPGAEDVPASPEAPRLVLPGAAPPPEPAKPAS
jgi:predicted PurR-regulated permease PerM